MSEPIQKRADREYAEAKRDERLTVFALGLRGRYGEVFERLAVRPEKNKRNKIKD